jgi:hypothetical protein
MRKVLGSLCGAVLLTSFLTAPAMASLWQGDFVCDLDRDGTFSDLSPQRPYAVIQGRGDVFVSSIHGLPPNTDFTCVIDCFLQGGTDFFPCGRSDAVGRLRAQRPEGFRLPPGVCAGIDFFLFDTDTGGDGVLCVGASRAP